LVFDSSYLETIYDQRGVQIGGTALVDPLYKLTEGYKGEHDAMIKGFFPNAVKEQGIIQEVMRLHKSGRLRAFGENPSNSREYPKYMMVLVPHVS